MSRGTLQGDESIAGMRRWRVFAWSSSWDGTGHLEYVRFRSEVMFFRDARSLHEPSEVTLDHSYGILGFRRRPRTKSKEQERPRWLNLEPGAMLQTNAAISSCSFKYSHEIARKASSNATRGFIATQLRKQGPPLHNLPFVISQTPTYPDFSTRYCFMKQDGHFPPLPGSS